MKRSPQITSRARRRLYGVCLLLVFALPDAPRASAERVFIINWKGGADRIVYETNLKSEADLIVYRTVIESEAVPDSGIWFFTNLRTRADLKIYFTPYKDEANLKVYFTTRKDEAGPP